MINTVIVEDEPLHMENLASALSEVVPEVNIIAKISSGKDAINLLPKLCFDLLFLDIELGDKTAFDVIEKLKNHKYPIIFITAYDKYAVQAFKVNAIDYLLKPLDEEELKAAVSKAVNNRFTTDKKNNLLADYHMEKSGKLMVKEKESITFLSYDNIIYCVSDSNYTEVYYSDNGNEKHLLSTKNLKYYDEKLSRYGFVRVNQSVLINGKKVKKIIKRKKLLVLQNETVFTIAKRRKTEIIRQLEDILS